MKSIYGLLIALFIATIPAFAQDQENANDIISQMQHDLNLSEDQVANITQIVERYTMAANDLQKSINDRSINPSDIDSQRRQIRADEEQGIAQYLRPDQLYEWHEIQAQMDQQKDKDSSDDANADTSADSGEYSNLPRETPSQ